MKMTFRTLAAMCAMAFSLSGCTNDNTSQSGSSNELWTSSGTEHVSVDGITPPEEAEMLEQVTCSVEFSDAEIKVEGTGAAVNGNTVTISSAGVYSLSGKSSDVKVLINAEKSDVKLLLNGVELTSKNGSVIDCEKAKQLTLCVVGGTKNTISDTNNYTFAANEDEPDAAVFSRSDTVITGSGELALNGQYKDAIKCKDGLTIGGGKLSITSAADAITGKDYAVVYGGEISIVSGGDGIKSTNSTDEGYGYVTVTDGSLNIESEKDGIQAETLLTISGGDVKIKAGGDEADAEIKASERGFDDWDKRGGLFTVPNGQSTSSQTSTSTDDISCKGLKAGGNILISGGEFNILSADDSIHSNASVTIENGTFALSSCDDGIHAGESLIIKNGTITISKSYEGLEGKCIEISGGKIDLKAVDDGMNAADGSSGNTGFGNASKDCYISISGGEITVNADGDGIDSNGTIAQSGGVLTVFGPTNSGNGAIDYESSYALSGGTLIALGSSGMAQAPSTLSQPCLSINANVAAGSVIEVRDSNGNTILSVTTPKVCQSIVLSCDKMTSGSDYSIYSGDTLLQTVTATDGVAGGGANGSGFGGGHGGFNRDDFGGTKPDGMTPPDGTTRPAKPERPVAN